MPARVLVTRPEREAQAWVQDLASRGVSAQALPLIGIHPAPQAQALAHRRAALAQDRAVMFVSANAVRGFLSADAGPWPAGTRAWATGAGTQSALLAAGVPASQVDVPSADSAQFDSETLWAQVGGQVRAGDRVLIVRGGDESGQPAGRDWLAGQLAAAGVQVDTVVAYRRGLPVWEASQQALARAASQDGRWWLLSSSEAVANLGRLLPDVSWSAARAVCTHPRIAQAARQAGFGQVAQARPLPADVAAFLQSQP